MLMRLQDSAVHSRSQAEVVRVNNQPPHDASLAGQRPPDNCLAQEGWMILYC